MNKDIWMYLFLLILAGILLRNAAGSVGLMLAGGNVASGFVTALEGPATASTKGSFSFGTNRVTLG